MRWIPLAAALMLSAALAGCYPDKVPKVDGGTLSDPRSEETTR